MKNNFLKKKKLLKCSCSARNNAIFEDTFNEVISNSNSEVDILILLEFKEYDLKEAPFVKYLEKVFFNHKYVILYALGCTPEGFGSKDVLNTYIACKKQHVKKKINKYNPKVIITIGGALYSITESKELKVSSNSVEDKSKGGHFYALHEDDLWLYSPEFGCKVFPVPPLYKFSGFDNYENEFMKAQLKRAKVVINERKSRTLRLSYNEIKDENKFLKSLIEDNSIKAIAIDTETTGLNWIEDTIYSIQFSYNRSGGYFLLFENINKQLLIDLFNTNKIFIFQNAVFDLKMLKNNGIYNAHCNFDTLLASHQLNENSPNGLKTLAWLYTHYGGYDNELEDYKKKFNIGTDYSLIAKELLIKYGCYDVIITFQLYSYFLDRFEQEDKFVVDNYYNHVIPSIEMAVDLEMTGIQIDMNYLFEYAEELYNKAIKIEKEIYEKIGFQFNIRSGKELTKVFLSLSEFEILLDKNGNELKTKNGDLVLNKAALEAYAENGIEIAKVIIEYNHIMKELSQLGLKEYFEEKEKIKKEKNFLLKKKRKFNFNKGVLASIYKNRLYSSFNLAGTKTGRASGGGGLNSTVNFQNMQKSLQFRKMFLPSKGFIFGKWDYDGMEVRISSQISGPGVLEELINSGKDMHCYTAWKAMRLLGHDVTYEEVFNKTKIEGQEDPAFQKFRGWGKNTNWSCLYGSTEYGLVNSLGIKYEMAVAFLEAFYESYPEYKKYMNRNRKFARENGWVKTLLGRKRRIPKLTYQNIYITSSINTDNLKEIKKKSEIEMANLNNIAVNAPIQGTSGQNTIIAMTKINKYFKKKNMKSRCILNVHDEILFEIFLPEMELAIEKIYYYMEKPYYNNIKGNKITLTASDQIGIWGFGFSKKYYEKHKEKYDEYINYINERNDLLEKFNLEDRL